MLVQIIFFISCLSLNALDTSEKSSQMIFEQIKKDYQENKLENALRNIKILKSPYFSWSNNLQEIYWYELNIYQAVCDNQSFDEQKQR